MRWKKKKKAKNMYIVQREQLVRWKIAIEYCHQCTLEWERGRWKVLKDFVSRCYLVIAGKNESRRKRCKVNGWKPNPFTRVLKKWKPWHSMGWLWNGNGLGIKMFVKQERRHVDLLLFHEQLYKLMPAINRHTQSDKSNTFKKIMLKVSVKKEQVML